MYCYEQCLCNKISFHSNAVKGPAEADTELSMAAATHRHGSALLPCDSHFTLLKLILGMSFCAMGATVVEETLLLYEIIHAKDRYRSRAAV